MTQELRSIPLSLAAGLILAACGEEEAPPPEVSFSASGSSVGEGASGNVTVFLTTSEPLEQAVEVTVREGGGSASLGSDYVAFPDQRLVFPAGSTQGESQTVSVTMMDDSAIEGVSETVQLSLVEVSGAGVSVANHTISIADDDVAELRFASGMATDLSETAASVAIGVELSLDPGETLETDLSAEILVTSGTATNGDDFSFPAQSIAFSQGALDGEALDFTLSLVDDAELESSETVVIGFAGAGAGFDLDGTSHQFSILDDDLGSGTDLIVRMGTDGGPANDVNSGDGFDFGGVAARTLSSALRVEIQNGTVSDLELVDLRITGDSLDFAFETLPDGASAPPPATDVPPPFHEGAHHPAEGLALVLDPARCARLCELERVRMTDVAVGSDRVDLDLERVALPWSDDALVYVDGEPRVPADLIPGLSLWRGSVAGEPDSEVFLGVSTRGSSGWVRRGTERHDLISGRQSERATARLVPSVHIVPEHGGAPRICESPLAPPGSEEPEHGYTRSSLSLGFSSAPCRLAIETDYQYYQLFNDAGDLTTYVTELLAAISTAFERDLQATFEVAYLGIHTTAADGWTTQETSGTTGDLLTEFRTAWDGGAAPVSADLYHFFSGASLGGGVAYLDVLCHQNFGFAVSANLHGQINWSTFDHQPGSLTWDFVVVAHELGHNFGSPHTHDFCPAVDSCGSATCDAGQSCASAGSGTIMSYCHTCSGGMSNIRLEFAPRTAAVMRDGVATSCLGQRTLAPGATVRFDLSFAPLDTGAKAGTLTFGHVAGNQPTPFVYQLDGTGQ